MKVVAGIDVGKTHFYRRLRQRGKTGKVAVMRKLLLLLNAIAHRGTPWVEHQAPAV